MRKVSACLIIISLVLSLLSCSKYSGNYQEVKPMLDYICDNSQLNIHKIDVLWRSDEKLINYSADVSFVIEVSYGNSRIPIEYIDELRILANEYLTNNKDYFLNDGYTIFFVIKNPYRDYGDWTYAVFTNFEYDNEDDIYDSLLYLESYVYEEDFDYLSQMKNVNQFEPRFTRLIDDTDYVEGLLNSLRENKSIETIILPEQCKTLEYEFSGDVEVLYD